MGAEDAFAERLAARLRRGLLPRHYSIETKRSLLYSVSFDDRGMLQLGQNEKREPTRGGGTGFEQDLLIFERAVHADTAIVPRVSVELKWQNISTHDSIVYSEKAHRIRAVYPFVRYGLILGGQRGGHIPGRTLRLGTEFDFIIATPERISAARLRRIAKLLRLELDLSTKLTAVLRGGEDIAVLHRRLEISRSL